MVADKVTVVSRSLDSEQAYKWESSGADGYTIEEIEKEDVGTEITLTLKEDTEEESYSEYLEEFRLQEIIKKHSDFIRYPINMEVIKSNPKDYDSDEYIDYTEEETINSMIPIWRKNHSELTEEDYTNFYQEKQFGFDKPLTHIHTSVDGMISYHAILCIQETVPFNYYSDCYENAEEHTSELQS